MIVEICILSGSRQGERIEFDQLEFRAGSNPGSEVYFDPVRDPKAQGRAAVFRFNESDGWTLHNMGTGDLLVNHEPVANTAHLRSGDIVRFSELGPDLGFNILLHPRAAQASLAPGPAVAEELVHPVAMATAADAALTASPHEGLAEQEIPSAGWKAPVMVGAGIVLCLIALLFWPKATAKQDEQLTLSDEVEELTEPSEAVRPPAVEDTPEPPDNGKQDEVDQPRTPDIPEDSFSPNWSGILDRAREAVFLIVVEDPTGQASWPVANACAIRDDALLTSGTAASAIVSLRNMKLDNVHVGERKWAVWAQSASGVRRKVTAIRVHHGYEAQPEEDSENTVDPRMHFDLAILTVDGTLPVTLTVADRPAELLPIAALGIPYRTERVSPFQRYAAQLIEGRVEMLSHLDPHSAESPALLRVTLPIALPDSDALGPHQFGCPVVDQAGRLVGVYSSAGLTPEMQRANMHYAAETRLVALWLAGKGLAAWVEPLVPGP